MRNHYEDRQSHYSTQSYDKGHNEGGKGTESGDKFIVKIHYNHSKGHTQ